MSIVGPVELSLSWTPAAAPWALLPVWQETLGWSGAGSVSWGIFLDFREVGRRNCTGKKTESNRTPSLARRAFWALQTPKLWVENTPFSMEIGMVPMGKGEHKDVLFCNIQQEKRSKSSMSGWVAENFGRGSSQMSPWCQLVPSGLLLPGFSVLCGLYSNPVITPGCRGFWVGLGSLSQPLPSASSFSGLSHSRLSWLWTSTLFVCLLSCNFSCSIQPTSFTPISTTIPPSSRSFEG